MKFSLTSLLVGLVLGFILSNLTGWLNSRLHATADRMSLLPVKKTEETTSRLHTSSPSAAASPHANANPAVAVPLSQRLDTVHVCVLVLDAREELLQMLAKALKSLLLFRTGPLHIHFVSDLKSARHTRDFIVSLVATDDSPLRRRWFKDGPVPPIPGQDAFVSPEVSDGHDNGSGVWTYVDLHMGEPRDRGIRDYGGFGFPLLECSLHVVSDFVLLPDPYGLPRGNRVFDLARRENFKLGKVVAAPVAMDRAGVKRAIVFDCCDFLFQEDIRVLWRQFDRFGPPLADVDAVSPEVLLRTPMLALTRENVDTYFHAVSPWGQRLYLGNGTNGGWGFNSGLVLMDVDKLRRINFVTRAFDVAEKYFDLWKRTKAFKYSDQDVLNLFNLEFPEAMIALPCAWNYQLTHANNPRHRPCPHRVLAYHGNAQTFYSPSMIGVPQILHGISLLRKDAFRRLPLYGTDELVPHLGARQLASSVDEWAVECTGDTGSNGRLVGMQADCKSGHPSWTYGFVDLGPSAEEWPPLRSAFTPFSRFRQTHRYLDPSMPDLPPDVDLQRAINLTRWVGGEPYDAYIWRARHPARIHEPCSLDDELDICRLSVPLTMDEAPSDSAFLWSNVQLSPTVALTDEISINRYSVYSSKRMAVGRRYCYPQGKRPSRVHVFGKYAAGFEYYAERPEHEKNPEHFNKDAVKPCEDEIEVSVIYHKSSDASDEGVPEQLVRRRMTAKNEGNMVWYNHRNFYLHLLLHPGDCLDTYVRISQEDEECGMGVRFPATTIVQMYTDELL